MLTIRKAQMAVFGPLGRKAFEERALAHIKKVFPERFEALGEPKLREIIQYGTQRAAAYRIISERDVCKYIDVIILYGQDFDKDSHLPWASSILQNRGLRDSAVKADRLWRAAKREFAARQSGAGPS